MIEAFRRQYHELLMKRLGWIAVFVACLATLVVVLTPAVLIQPFAAQTKAAVAWSYALRQAAPTVSVARGPKLGSDHYPVVVILAPAAPR